MPPSDAERLAVLEAAFASVKEHIELDRQWKQTMDGRLDTMDKKFSRYVGFAGGMVFTLSAVWTLITFAFKVHNG